MPGFDQLARDLGVVRGALELHHRLFVPVEPQPRQAVEDRVDRGLRRAFAIRVLDAEQEAPTVVPREQPVEQGGAGTADVKEPRRRRSETSHDAHCEH